MRIFLSILLLGLVATRADTFNGALLQGMTAGGRASSEYFVDSVSGNDTNTGVYSTQPLKTFAAVLAKPLTDHAYIHLAKGSFWRESLTINKDYVTVDAYGTGATPIVDGSDIVSSNSWTKTGGLTSVYQTPITFGVGTIDAINAFENGVFLVWKTNTTLVDGTIGTYFVSTNVSPATLYVHATSGIPTNNGSIYEYASRLEQVSSGAFHGTYRGEHWTVNGINTRRNAGAAGSIALGRYAHVINCLIEQGSRHNLYVSDGCLIENTTLRGAYDFPVGPIPFVVNEDSPIGLGIRMDTVTIDSPVGTISAISHVNTGGSFSNVVANSITITGGTSGLTFGDVTGGSMTVSNYAGAAPSFAGGLRSASIVDSSLTTVLQVGTVGGTTIVNNVAITNSASGIQVTSSNVTLYVTNSAITLGQNGAAAIIVSPAATGCSIIRSNDTFNTTSGAYYRETLQSDSVIVASDYNTWSGSMQSPIYEEQFLTGRDLHSTPRYSPVLVGRWNLSSNYLSTSQLYREMDTNGFDLQLGTTSSVDAWDPIPGLDAALFTSVSNTFLLGPSLPAMSSNNPPALTVNMVFKWTGSVGGMTNRTIPNYLSGVFELDGGNTAHKMNAKIGPSGSASNVSNTSVDDGLWHLFTVCYTGSQIHLMLDGLEDATKAAANITFTAKTSPWELGGYFEFGTHNYGLQGKIAYSDCYTGIVSLPELAVIYSGLKTNLAAQGVTLP